jgi:catechol 2,3-dioxygenase-like lactoylglutathione lyase family enzyme
LGDKNLTVNIAVKDLSMAKKFYEGALDLKQVGSEGLRSIMFRSGTTDLLIYQSYYAGTNHATAVTWYVGENIEDIVQTLKAKSVTFEHYDHQNVTIEVDIHIDGKMKLAWLKDPYGNILSTVNER